MHKKTCAGQAALRQEHLRETPQQREWSKKIARWITAWTPAISSCTPFALDLGYHAWGRHETHRYIPFVV